MKNILHTIDTTGPGGAETVFIDLATMLPDDHYRSVVLIRGKGWVYDELVRRGIKPFIMDAKGSFNWRYLKGVVALIKQQNIDLVQSHLLGSNVYCSLAGLLTRRPVVATFHGSVDINSCERLMGAKFAAINMGARSIVTVSDNLRSDIVNRTPIRAGKCSVIYNGICADKFQRESSSEIRNLFGWSKNDVLVGCLGNVRPAKGYDILLRAAAMLRDRPEFRFVIAGHGKGKLYEDLLKSRKDLYLEDRVQFVGFKDDPAWFLANLDIFLLPSTSEGFSIATIQAMAAGLPVLVTRSGGPQEIVTHGRDGWIVEPGEAQAIVDGLLHLVEDELLRKSLSMKGRLHAIKTFGLDAMLGAYMNIYDSLI